MPYPCSTSTCRSLSTTSSGLSLFPAISGPTETGSYYSSWWSTSVGALHADGPVHLAWPAILHQVRQRHRVYCTEGPRLDHRSRRQNGLYRTRFTWENGYCESFNARFRDELLNGEIFYSLREAQILIEQWRIYYNTFRPHSSLGYRPPAPESIVPMD
jgi:putative transposase